MSWLCSRALVAEYSGENSSGGEPSAPLKSTPTAGEFFVIDRTTAPSTRSQFGTMSERLTATHGEALLTSFREDSRARTSRQREPGRVSAASARDYGPKWRGLSVKFDRDSCWWKTHHCLFPEDLPESSVTLPRWGLMRDGELWERITSVPLTSGTGFGLWQTPVADDAVNRKTGKWNSRGEPKLSAQVLLPTPRVSDAKAGIKITPTIQRRVMQQMATLGELTTFRAGGGPLNPNWVEWLMGWPIGHTALGPLEMDRFQQWQQQHGGS